MRMRMHLLRQQFEFHDPLRFTPIATPTANSAGFRDGQLKLWQIVLSRPEVRPDY